MMSRFLVLVGRVSLAGAFSLCLFAQKPGGGSTAPGPVTTPGGNTGGSTGNSTGFPGSNTGRTPGTTMPGNTNTPGRMPGDLGMQQPIFLSGKVMMEDGTPPQEPVLIERVCGGNPRPEGYTDHKGRFSFALGQNNTLLADASVASPTGPFGGGTGNPTGMGPNQGISPTQLMNCELRATLPGYRSSIVNLAGRRAMENPDVGTILLKRLGNVEGLTVSATMSMAPKDAKKAFDKGRDAAKKGKWNEAQKEFEKAVESYPKFANAWYELGLVHERLEHKDDARKAYQEAIAKDSKLINPYLQLAFMNAQENKWKDVQETTDRAIKLNPFDFPRAYFLNAVANLNLQNLEAAEKSAREGVKIDTDHKLPKIEHVLGVVLAQKQDYAGAADHFRAFLKSVPEGPDATTVQKQLAEVEKLTSQKTQ